VPVSRMSGRHDAFPSLDDDPTGPRLSLNPRMN
jgi:hypothetical protein